VWRRRRRRLQAGGVAEVAAPDVDAERRELGGMRGVADADADLVGGHAFDELVDDGAAELASGSGDRGTWTTPVGLSVIAANTWKLALIISANKEAG
jgi:hypothetical protein